MAIFPEIAEKECVKDRHPHSTATIRLVQHLATILSIAELLYCFSVARLCGSSVSQTTDADDAVFARIRASYTGVWCVVDLACSCRTSRPTCCPCRRDASVQTSGYRRRSECLDDVTSTLVEEARGRRSLSLHKHHPVSQSFSQSVIIINKLISKWINGGQVSD